MKKTIKSKLILSEIILLLCTIGMGSVFYMLFAEEYYISQKKRLMKQAFEALKEEDLEQMRKFFVNNVSHELKTPLAIISSQTEMLLYLKEEEDRKAYCESIMDEAAQMSNMVSSMLAIFSIEQGLEGKIVLSVYNDGKNIDEGEIEKIWNSFYCGEGSDMVNGMNGDFKGTGLGLYIVKSIIKLHYGACGVRNEKEGVTFWCSLDEWGEASAI